MRILHVIPQFPYFSGRTIVGGHANSVLNLALAQADAGDEVTILSYVGGKRGEFSIADRVQVCSLFERGRPGTLSFGMKFCRSAANWAKARRGVFDLVHGHSGYAEYFLVTRILQRALRCPTAHTMYCPIPSNARARLPLVHGVLRRGGARFDTLVAISSNVAQSLSEFGLPQPEIIAPALDLERFRPVDPAPRRAALGLDPTQIAILFVGNAKPQKNLSGLLRAFARLREQYPAARLVVTTELAQSAPDHRLAELRQEMITLGVAEHVVQEGIVDDMPTLMQACDLLVAPFLDTFGPSDYFLAALEAMACAKPVVVSAVGGMPEVVSNEHGFLVDPRDEQGIAEALSVLLADADRRRAAGQQARRQVERRFDARQVATRYRALYRRISP